MKERTLDINYLKRLIKEELNEKWFDWQPGVKTPRSREERWEDLKASWEKEPEEIPPEDRERMKVHNERQTVHNAIGRLQPGISDRRDVDMDATIEKVYNFIKGL